MKVKVLNAQTQLEIREIDLPETMAKHGECLFGRSPNSALVLDSPDVSRMHGKFLLDQGQYYFYDLGSANGSTINGQLAQANHRYSLKSGDIIRVGEFVLLLHEVLPEELPATVIGDPNATIVNDVQFDRIMSFVQASQPAPAEIDKPDTSTLEPVEAILVTLEAKDSIAATPLAQPVKEELVEELQPEIVASQEEMSLIDLASDSIIQKEAVTPAELGTVESEAAEEPLLAKSESKESTETNLEEIASELDIPEPVNEAPVTVADSTVIQLPEDEAIAESDEVPSSVAGSLTTENLVSSPEVVTDTQPVSEETPPSLEDDPWDNPLPVMASPETVSIAQPTINEVFANQVAIAPEDATNIQSAELLSEQADPKAPAIDESATVIQDPELLEQPVTELEEPLPEEPITAHEDATVIQSSELLEQPNTPEFEEPVTTIEEDATVVQSSEPVEQPAPILAAQAEVQPSTIEETASPIVIESAASLISVAPEVDESEQPEPTIADLSDTQAPAPSVQKSQIISTKYIALLAHDSQIEALNQLANRYQDLLGHCKTIATPTISEALLNSSGISVSQQTPAVSAGGYQTLNGLITSDQVLAVIFLRDFLTPQPTQVNDEALSRSCNVYRVLFATNAHTAEAVLHYIQTVVAVA